LRGKFYFIILVLIVLVGTFSSHFKSVTITNQGRIGIIKTPITYKSEIRGVFIHEAIYSYPHDWTTIAETLANYGINVVFVNDFDIFHRRPDSEITAAINAFHSVGIEYHACMSGIAESYNPETAAVNSSGGKPNPYQQCPIQVKPYVEAAIRNYIGNHSDVDGIMLDYYRIGTGTFCYCDHCKVAFQEWLGENITDWTPFYPDGSRWIEYANWMNEPVNDLIKTIHDTAKALKPNIIITACPWAIFDDCPIYWRKWLAQDVGRWIKEGWVDMVAPMWYTEYIYGEYPPETLEDFVNTTLHYWTGDVEGKIPLLAFLGLSAKNATNFAAQVEYIRSRGVDGWIFWRYGGPGVESEGALTDITPWLAAVSMPQTFTLGNIQVSTTETSATITWITTLPATSKIEYSILPLFNATWEIWGNFPYWHINHIPGTIIENITLVVNHNITLTNLTSNTKYYFRIQSEGPGGVVTTETLTFTTK